MQNEMNSLHENRTYNLVKFPNDKRALTNNWVYNLKPGEDGQLPIFKDRIVLLVNKKKGVDFNEFFSPLMKMSLIKVILGLVASMNLDIEQLNVKTTFLYGDQKEEIDMEQPKGFVVKGKEKFIRRLKKNLYGLQ